MLSQTNSMYCIYLKISQISSGRKTMSIMFGILYSLSCITKLWNDFYVLLIGRLLSGIATSLLFSVFEAWMVFEHNKV